MTRKKKEPERTTIITSPNRRPYGAKLTLLLEKYTNFHIYSSPIPVVELLKYCPELIE